LEQCGKFAPIGQDDSDAIRVPNDVMVREDGAVFGDDEARTLPRH